VVVEGYLDALIPLQAGLSNIVATLGTALTERHVRLLSRYTQEVVLIFDADAAGVAAAGRALEVFLAQRVNVRVATIPAGKDPCDYCLAEGPEAVEALVAGAPDALRYAWNQRQAALLDRGASLTDRRAAVQEFLSLVASSAAYGAIDEVRRGQLAQHIGHMLNVRPEDLQQQMRQLARQARPDAPRQAGQTGAGGMNVTALAERHVLEVLLSEGELFDQAVERVHPEDFLDVSLREIARRVWRMGEGGRIALDELLAGEEVPERAALTVELAMEGQKRGNGRQTLEGALEQMICRRGRQEVQDLKQSGLDDETLRQLGRRFLSPDARKMPKIR
jgi:DNA primase